MPVFLRVAELHVDSASLVRVESRFLHAAHLPEGLGEVQSVEEAGFFLGAVFLGTELFNLAVDLGNRNLLPFGDTEVFVEATRPLDCLLDPVFGGLGSGATTSLVIVEVASQLVFGIVILFVVLIVLVVPGLHTEVSPIEMHLLGVVGQFGFAFEASPGDVKVEESDRRVSIVRHVSRLRKAVQRFYGFTEFPSRIRNSTNFSLDLLTEKDAEICGSKKPSHEFFVLLPPPLFQTLAFSAFCKLVRTKLKFVGK